MSAFIEACSVLAAKAAALGVASQRFEQVKARCDAITRAKDVVRAGDAADELTEATGLLATAQHEFVQAQKACALAWENRGEE